MGIGAGLALITLGAIFAFAIDVNLSGVNIHAIGWILMLVGLVGIGISVFYWGPRKRRGSLVRETVYTDDPTQPPPPA